MTNHVWKTLSGFDPLHYPVPEDGCEPHYVVLSKTADGGYEEFARCTSASEGWAKRKHFADTNPARKFFLRLQLTYVVGPSSPESRDDRDLWRDAYRTGNDKLVVQQSQSPYRQWVAKRVNPAQAQARFGGAQ